MGVWSDVCFDINDWFNERILVFVVFFGNLEEFVGIEYIFVVGYCDCRYFLMCYFGEKFFVVGSVV